MTGAMRAMVTVAVSAMLTACGAGDGTAEGGTTSDTVRAKARFEGHKLAPPQDRMDYWAGMAVAEKQEVAETPDLGRTCRYAKVMDYWRTPDKVKPECHAAFEAVATTAVFTPRNCKEGVPDRGGILPYGDVLEAVTCEGFVETAIGEGDVRMVYHRAREQWFGYADGRVNWTPRG